MAYSEPKSAAEKWQKDHAVYTQVVVSASKKLPEKWQKPAALVAPALAAVAVVVSVIGPLYYAAGVKLYELYHVRGPTHTIIARVPLASSPGLEQSTPP